MIGRARRTTFYRPAGVTIGGGLNGRLPNIYIKYHQRNLDRVKALNGLPTGQSMEILPALSTPVKNAAKIGFGNIVPRVLADKLHEKNILVEFGIGKEIRELLPQEGLVDTFIAYGLREVLEALSLPSDTALPFIELLNRPFGSFSHSGLDKMVRERFEESPNLLTNMAKAGLTLGEALLTLQFVEAYKVAKEQEWI